MSSYLSSLYTLNFFSKFNSSIKKSRTTYNNFIIDVLQSRVCWHVALEWNDFFFALHGLMLPQKLFPSLSRKIFWFLGRFIVKGILIIQLVLFILNFWFAFYFVLKMVEYKIFVLLNLMIFSLYPGANLEMNVRGWIGWTHNILIFVKFEKNEI